MKHRTQGEAKEHAAVKGRRMAYMQMGVGEPVCLFLHGNPTSSYLWRNVMPAVAERRRCVAPDLIGMGDSDKLEPAGPGTYRFATHREFLEELVDQVVGRAPVVLVVHDWGSALGFDWANHHRERVAGIVYMEALVRPLAWPEWPSASRALFQSLRSGAGEKMVLERNLFVERILPGSILRTLAGEEMAEYRRPFAQPNHRWPTLEWPRQIPVDGEPADVVELARDYAAWMAHNEVPKLFVNADPGAILIGPQREFCRTWRNQTEVTVRGSHFLQEDSGPQIGQAIAEWVSRKGDHP